MDEMIYLFRKRVDKLLDIFLQDIYILSDKFGQAVRGLYVQYKQLKSNVYSFSEELPEYTTEVRSTKWKD
ncbi:hypothetical protein PanWU01x14_038860 [Parasponia andersonii]|uniref:Uncharacterized protein n=1 Tax=Parasponia andersonii TaxID=3476 RepID=A0A2P5DRL5_PARAD|nr:hypothetical protein PanWU01x14_038860 [Parasponia andersonii]